MQDKLIARAKELLAEGKVQKVVGWKKGLFEDDITPAVFTTAEELDKDFVFNKYCKANLSKYLVKITIGQGIIRTLVFAYVEPAEN